MKTIFLVMIFAAGMWGRSLTIAGTADLQGIMSPSGQRMDLDGDGKKETVKLGGIARLATIFRRIKAENPDTLVLSAGDDLMGRYFHTFKGKAIFSLMTAAGYDYFVFGNHEFDHGPGELAEALDAAGFVTICSDLELTPEFGGKTVPWALREIGGTKVGIFSLMNEGFETMTRPEGVKMKGPNVETARAMVGMLREKGAKVIVALTHLGYKNDVALAKQVKGIDLIFGGHSHHYPRKMGHIGKTAIVNGGEQGALAVRVDLPLDGEGRVRHKAVRMRYVPVEMNLSEAPDVVKMLEGYRRRFPKEIVLGRSGAPWDLSVKTVRKGESGVADMVNDLLRRKFRVDIVLNNGGAFRGKAVYPAGPVTDRMLRAVDEFHNAAYIMRLRGRWIREILEHSAAQYGKGGWMQLSGIRYTVDLRQPMQKTEGERILRPGKRVKKIEVYRRGRWEALDDEKEYRVLSNAFLVQKAGDGYYWFRKYGRRPVNTYTTFYSVMAEELDAKKVLTPPEPDGRIEIIR